jgi:glutamyl-tRNA synthetase
MSAQPSAPVVTRFAPSPTGHLHIGGARSALFCWAFAKAHPSGTGRFMVRIEDTDQARSSEESARGILEDLAWLGIEWDDGPQLKLPDGRVIGAHARPVGPYFQAQRVPIYNKYIHQLIEASRAYPAFEAPDELEAKRKAAVAAKQTYRYDRAAFNAIPTPAARLQRMAEADKSGQPYVVRFLAPHEEIVVHDQILGDVKIAPGELDDFVIRKADGFPTYHFAVVVDDQTMGVTHVMRAQEHLSNTPRHVALQKALGFRTPVYGHMPLIFNPDGSKMSKRDKAKVARKTVKDAMARDKSITAAALSPQIGINAADLTAFINADNDRLDIAEALARHFKIALPEIEIYDFRRSGYLPEAIINFVSLLGWNPGMKTADGKDLEKFDLAFLAKHFSMDRIGRTNAKFDRAKLLSFNGDYLQALPRDQFAARFMAWCHENEPAIAARLAALPDATLAALLAMTQPRCKVFRDALKVVDFALIADEAITFDPAAADKNLRANNNEGLKALRAFRPTLAALAPFDASAIHTAMEQFAASHFPPDAAGKSTIGKLAQPLRVALTGTSVSPPLNEAMAVLGRDSVLRRVDRCLAIMEK